MKYSTIIVTRNKACHVRTLHTVLNLNTGCIQNNYKNNICHVNDDPESISRAITAEMKTSDRLLFIDYSISMDTDSIRKCLAPKFEGYDALVFPCVVEGVNWDRFSALVKENQYGDEPVDQLGLDFDTEVSGRKLADDVYRVETTNPRCWVLDCAAVKKCVNKEPSKKKKSAGAFTKPKLSGYGKELFELFKDKNVRVCAYTAARLITVFTHECIGNIPNSMNITIK